MVASMIFVRCGICPTVGRMATELIAYVRPHRYSENPKVRGACLAAHLNVVALLPKELSIQLFSVEERQEWVDWAGHVATSVQSLQVEHDLAAQLISMIVEQDQED
uniref:Uncharacterized protein n=1 Tax=Caenorhabditis japonica TaxID=281687 RepID=A0A8R1ELF2_CAEJA